MLETTAHVDVPADRISPLLTAGAHRHGLSVQTGEGGLAIMVGDASIRLHTVGTGSRITIAAPRNAHLHALREEVAEHLGPVIGPLSWTGGLQGVLPGLSCLAAAGVQRISPSFLRLRLVGDVAAFRSDRMHVRLIAPGKGAQIWPLVSADGKTLWAGDTPLPHRPVYTVIDVGGDWLDIDIFDHADGRTRDWALSLRPGDPVGLTGPGGSAPPGAPRLALFGDETALPAIARALRTAPPGTEGQANILVPGIEDCRDWRHPRIAVRWLLRAKGDCLLGALSDALAAPDPGFVWFASERDDCVRARDLAAERGLSKDDHRIAGYWTRPGPE